MNGVSSAILLLVLSTAIAQTRADGNGNDSDPDPIDISFVGMWAYTQKECEKNGYNGSLITKSWIGVRACFRDKMDVIQLNTDSIRMDVDNQEEILEKHCPNLLKSASCFDPFMATVKTCIPVENFEIFEALKKWLVNVVGHVCKDNGAHIKYDRVKHDKCMAELGGYGIGCAAQSGLEMQFENRKSFTEEDCSKLIRLKECLVKKLSECSVLAAMAELFYIHFVSITSCSSGQRTDGSDVSNKL